MGAHFTPPEPAEMADVRRELEALLAMAGTARHMRRELEAAAERGATLLDALDLPPLALDVLDATIARLDALDGDTDLEPWLAGDYDGAVALDAEADHAHGFADDEPSLGAPENHPARWHTDMACRHHVGRRHHPLGDQTTWAAGQDAEADSDDREPEAGYCLPEGEDAELEDDGLYKGEGEDTDREPDLGAPIGNGDQRQWAQGDSRSYEDMTEGDGQLPADWYLRPIGPMPFYVLPHDTRRQARTLARQAEAMRRRLRPERSRDPDLVIFLRGMPPSTALWSGPTRTRSGVDVVGEVGR